MAEQALENHTFADFSGKKYESEIQGISASQFTVDRAGNIGEMVS
jgi:hypothetical protein